MVIPQARHQKSTVRIDDFRIPGSFKIDIGGDAHDSLATNEHAPARRHGEIAGIEQTRVANDKIAIRFVRKVARDPSGPRSLGFLLRCSELIDC